MLLVLLSGVGGVVCSSLLSLSSSLLSSSSTAARGVVRIVFSFRECPSCIYVYISRVYVARLMRVCCGILYVFSPPPLWERHHDKDDDDELSATPFRPYTMVQCTAPVRCSFCVRARVYAIFVALPNRSSAQRGRWPPSVNRAAQHNSCSSRGASRSHSTRARDAACTLVFCGRCAPRKKRTSLSLCQ